MSIEIRTLLDLNQLRVILESYTSATGIEIFLVETSTFLKLITTEKDVSFVISNETEFDIIENIQGINIIRYKDSIYAQSSIYIQEEEVLKLFAGNFKSSNENLVITKEHLLTTVINLSGVINTMIQTYDMEKYIDKPPKKLDIRDLEDDRKKEIEALLGAVIQQIPAGVMIAYPDDLEYIYLTPRIEHTVGDFPVVFAPHTYGREGFSHRIFKKNGEEYEFNDLPLAVAILEKKVITDVELFVLDTRTGIGRWLLTNAAPVLNADGEVVLGVTVFIDITERKHAEETINNITRELKVKNIALLEKEQALLTQNEDLQAKEEELVAQNEELQAKEEELIIQNKELLEQEKEIKDANSKFRAISENALDPIMMCNDRYEVIYWNSAAEKQFGYTPEEIIWKQFADYILPKDLHKVFSLRLDEIKNTGTTDIIGKIIERPLLKKDKSTFIAEISISKVHYGESTVFIAFFRDITQRKALENELLLERKNLEQTVKLRTEELQESLAKLEIANKHKDKFLSNMSHELRTPLNAIIGFTQALNLQYFGALNNKQVEYVSLITSSGEHLLALINDLLDITKIDAGAMEVHPSTIVLKEFLKEVVNLMSNQFANNYISLSYSIDSSIYKISTDKMMLKQVIFNLLSNALKFTPSGGQVKLSVIKIRNNKIKIAVQDTGIGIRKEDQKLIFSEFYQIDQLIDKQLGGTGIGLALTKRLVDLLGGEIHVESEPDEGSTFWFTLSAE